jgi:hypothetical protein
MFFADPTAASCSLQIRPPLLTPSLREESSGRPPCSFRSEPFCAKASLRQEQQGLAVLEIPYGSLRVEFDPAGKSTAGYAPRVSCAITPFQLDE